MGVPPSSISIGFSLINHPFWGTTILGNPHNNICIYIYIYLYFDIILHYNIYIYMYMCIHHCMFVTGLSWRQAMESSQKLVGLVPCPGHDMSPKASGKDSRRKSSSWVNYNDLTSRPSPGIMVFIGEIIPKWPNNSGE